MKLARFVESLVADGRVLVSTAVDQSGTLLVPSTNDLDEAASILLAFEREYRLDLPGEPPEISRSALLWGAVITFRAGSFLAHRDVDAAIIRRAMLEPRPDVVSPSACYSVDLTLRFLPDLIRLAKAVSETDPLVDVLMGIAKEWPLSSVGVTNVGVVDVQSILASDFLLRLYVDRIIATKDHSRVSEPKVRDAVQAAIGIHHDLAPELAQDFAPSSPP